MSLHQPGAALQRDSLPRVFGRYLLVERLSQGGMGEIFLARHGLSGFEKLIVIKKILPHLSADQEFLGRFIDEAQVAVHLQHANVAQVFEVGRVEDEYFLALEYVAGNDLRATLMELDDRQRAMPAELALFVAREAASGLAYAHRRTDATGKPLAVVHCDISPPNIVMSFDGEVKIIDFGIARSASRLTETNPDRGFGKFGYLAPEQLLKGQPIDARTDVYALGVVLYEMLTGSRMFEVGESPDYQALAKMVVKGTHPLPSAVNARFRPYDELVSRALRPDPVDRFQTAAEFRDAIQRALVTTGPTTNADHLAALMTDLFAGGESDRRRLLAQIDQTELEQWRRELDTQARSTVSFARAGSPLSALQGLPAHDRFDLTPSRAATEAAPAEVEAEADPTRPVDIGSGEDPARPDTSDLGDLHGDDDQTRERRPSTMRSARPRWAWAAMVGGAAVAVALTWATLAGAFSRSSRAESSAVAAPAVAPQPPPPTVTALPPQAGLPQVKTGSRSTASATPEPVVQPIIVSELPADPAPGGARPTSAPKATPDAPASADRSRRARPGKAPPAPTTDGAVESRFRAASREYARFKQRYGARLEAEWNDLAHLATYAHDQGRLAELDRKITRFRARMRAAKRN